MKEIFELARDKNMLQKVQSMEESEMVLILKKMNVKIGPKSRYSKQYRANILTNKMLEVRARI